MVRLGGWGGMGWSEIVRGEVARVGAGQGCTR